MHRNFIPDLATVIHATVTSRLDYCNSLYAGLPMNLLRKLQSKTELFHQAGARAEKTLALVEASFMSLGPGTLSRF